MSDNRCPNCETPFRQGANFCNACGVELPHVDADAVVDVNDTAIGRDTVRAGPGADTSLAAITHILGLFTSFLGPLLILLVTDDPFVERNAKNALNWQIWFLIYATIAAILTLILVGFIALVLLILADLLFTVIAAVRASEGEAWKYPLTPALVK